jgi:hypothetical protein
MLGIRERAETLASGRALASTDGVEWSAIASSDSTETVAVPVA